MAGEVTEKITHFDRPTLPNVVISVKTKKNVGIFALSDSTGKDKKTFFKRFLKQ